MDKTTDASIEALYREAFPAVARIVAKMGGDLNSAKDIFHDALIIYIEKERMQTLGKIVSAKAYVVGIARILWIRKYNRDVMHITMAGEAEHIADAQDNDRPKTCSLRPCWRPWNRPEENVWRYFRRFIISQVQCRRFQKDFNIKRRVPQRFRNISASKR